MHLRVRRHCGRARGARGARVGARMRRRATAQQSARRSAARRTPRRAAPCAARPRPGPGARPPARPPLTVSKAPRQARAERGQRRRSAGAAGPGGEGTGGADRWWARRPGRDVGSAQPAGAAQPLLAARAARPRNAPGRPAGNGARDERPPCQAPECQQPLRRPSSHGECGPDLGLGTCPDARMRAVAAAACGRTPTGPLARCAGQHKGRTRVTSRFLAPAALFAPPPGAPVRCSRHILPRCTAVGARRPVTRRRRLPPRQGAPGAPAAPRE